MTAPVALIVAVAAGLALAEIKRWAPWLAKKIVDRAALRYDEPKRAIELETGRANVDVYGAPISQLLYAFYTYLKAPFRAREQRAGAEARRPGRLPFLGAAMTAQISVFAVAVAGLGAVGAAVAAGIGGLALAAFGVGLDAVYRKRRAPSRASIDRERHDRLVRRQIFVVAVSSGILLVAGDAEAFPLWAAPAIVQGLILCLAVGSLTVYASSLVDWYCIVPSVSGLVGDAPCERADPRRWRMITRFWFLHRAIAACVVALATMAVPAAAAVVSDAPTTQAIWTIATVALFAGFVTSNRGVAMAFHYVASPPVSVGDVVRVSGATDRDAYVVDVSAFRIKYRFLDEGDSATLRSAGSGEVLPLREVTAMVAKRAAVEAPCQLAGRCRAVNPYCNRNIEA